MFVCHGLFARRACIRPREGGRLVSFLTSSEESVFGEDGDGVDY